MGLRLSYDTDENGLFVPEYVNVFGVPLSISERVGEGGYAPPPPKPSTQIKVIPERAALEICWPNVLRIESVLEHQLAVDWERVDVLTLDPASTPITADLAPALGGAADMSKVTAIDLGKLPDGFRLQRLVFQAARKGFAAIRGSFKGAESLLIFQLGRILEAFLQSDRLQIPSLFHSDPLRRRILIALNIDLVVQHILAHVVGQNITKAHASLRRGAADRRDRADADLVHDQALRPVASVAHQPCRRRFRLGAVRGERLREA